MDEINAFFDLSSDYKPKQITRTRGVISGNSATLAHKHASSKIPKTETIGTAYANAVVIEEECKMRDFDAPTTSAAAMVSRMETMEYLSDNDNDSDISIETDYKYEAGYANDAVYSNYNFNMQHDENLPIFDSKQEILDTINNNPVIVLQGDTGCGKTTQVPQYILHDAYLKRKYCKIVVTQPRRIAAISIARRVAAERKWNEGTVVGYQVGLHANLSEDTRLLFCTTGVLLQKLIQEKSLTRFTHIILDEVHERDADMDFLLILIRRLLTTNSKRVKIILMSATIDTNEFSHYFKIRNKPAPILSVDKRRLYNVREYYLDDLNRINADGITVDINNPSVSKDLIQICVKLVVVIENIEKQELALNTDNIVDVQKNAAILVFLPGIFEIDQLYKRMEELTKMPDINIKLFPLRLHSMIAPDEQIKVFHQTPAGFRKVILATNIAESSITIPDVKYVIDFCLTKVLVTDSATDFTSLQLQWASKANCRQRSGRAGRVANGRAYRLITRSVYKNLCDYSDPEMLRCPLENIVLKSKLLDMGSPHKILGLAMNPPNLSDIVNTILKLKELGGLFLYSDKMYSKYDGDLTFIGRVMAHLPLDIRLTRLIILGYLYSCLDDAIIIAAGLSVRSIFNFNYGKQNGEMNAFMQKHLWAHGTSSDLLAILRAYNLWLSMREQRIHNSESEKHWAARFLINLRSIKEMHLLIKELHQRLHSIGIREDIPFQRVRWTERELIVVLKVVIAGAFYPNYFTRTNLNDVDHERKISQMLDGNDPCTTVYYTNFSSNLIGPLYNQAIKENFRDLNIDPRNIEVRFPSGSEKVFVTFKGETNHLLMQGHVRPEIFRAIFMRISGMRTNLRVMDPRAAERYVKEHGIGYFQDYEWRPALKNNVDIQTVVLPSLFEKTMRGYISQIETCSKFYFQPLSEGENLRETMELLREINDDNCFPNPAAVTKGMILAAPFEGSYHRAKVLNVITTRHQLQFKLMFIDYGNTTIIDFDKLRAIPTRFRHLLHLPPRCFECRLSMIQPSYIKSPNGQWHDEAIELLQSTADQGVVDIEVYSIVNGVVSVILFENNTKITTFNDKLVNLGLARTSDENYMSKFDHDLRMRKQTQCNHVLEDDYIVLNQDYKRSVMPQEEIIIDNPPPPELCTKYLKLRGPFSPLETKLFSAVRVGQWKTVLIERDSVNCALLDTDPHDMHERLMVAASVTEAANSDTLMARSTTLMPNIHGFGALMTMLFCPRMQIKPNKERTKYSTILAGLGYDENTMTALYPEHDIVMNLDVDILTNDLELINQLRYCMDGMLYTAVGSERLSTAATDRADLAMKIKILLTRLLNKNRKYVEININSRDYVWEVEDPNDVIEMPQLFSERSLFPMHSALRLLTEDDELLFKLHQNCQELHNLRQFDGSIRPIECKLCKKVLENVVQIRIHLLSQLHRDRESQINFKQSMF